MGAWEYADVETAETLGVCLALCADLVGEEPTEAQVKAYVENDVFSEAPAAAENANVVAGLAKLQAWCNGFAAMDAAASSDAAGALRREWFALFVGAGVPDAPCWATYYSDPNHQMVGRETLAVRAAYASVGLRIEKTNGAPDDHLMYMLRFLAHAMSAEAQAAAAGETQKADQLQSLQRDFVVEHVLPWIARWAYVAQRDAKSDFFRGVAYLTFGFVEEYAKRFNVVFKEETRTFVQKRA